MQTFSKLISSSRWYIKLVLKCFWQVQAAALYAAGFMNRTNCSSLGLPGQFSLWCLWSGFASTQGVSQNEHIPDTTNTHWLVNGSFSQKTHTPLSTTFVSSHSKFLFRHFLRLGSAPGSRYSARRRNGRCALRSRRWPIRKDHIDENGSWEATVHRAFLLKKRLAYILYLPQIRISWCGLALLRHRQSSNLRLPRNWSISTIYFFSDFIREDHCWNHPTICLVVLYTCYPHRKDEEGRNQG